MIKQITPKELMDKIKTNSITLIDVRTIEENQELRIPNSLHKPLDTFNPKEIINITKNEICIYCRSGKRSMSACLRLEKLIIILYIII